MAGENIVLEEKNKVLEVGKVSKKSEKVLRRAKR